MDKVAKLSPANRRDLFEAAAAKRGLHPAVVEKDFWVCWSLKRLFSLPGLAEHLVFKGGTALAKVDGLIERFSEDIDLVLDWELLGYGGGGADPWEPQASNTKLDKLSKEINAHAGEYLEQTLCPLLNENMGDIPGLRASVSPHEQLTINIHYPEVFGLEALRPDVKLEIGPLASRVPSRRAVIRPYAAEEFPKVFDDPDCHVTAIRGERTFWEKATILHREAHRVGITPKRYSRHYYDLFQMRSHPVAASAIKDLDLLADVIRFKQRFYRSGWALYELAKPGSFRLLPTEKGGRELAADYRRMRPMFFSEPPPWDRILKGLGQLELAINQLEPQP
ncbi:MAG: nucleotidyl transferase AbiEii/AbiGii toxin family protein [Verrucomicrobia bacterium]|nr:nucleotidyl transferase AbiEii/AbiGii toxin family protein [Verrucomicrobiota bacterium]MCH8512549.1 nucleotidyl transferase AbiEii/AbiGii toxin family protein [Kiritimatiellia bacterium]